MIRTASDHQSQGELPFSFHDDYSRGLQAPGFQRAPREGLDGISPHEAFQFISNIRELPEKGVIKQLARLVYRKRDAIRKLLHIIANGRAATSFQQQEQAVITLNAMDTLNDLELAWHLFELNLTSLLDRLPPPHDRFADIFHKRMGGFRRQIAKVIENS